MKKLNAVLACLTIICLIGHFTTMSYSLLTGWYDFTLCKSFARATAALASAHFAITMVIFFFNHDGAELLKYGKRNITTVIQRVTALAITLLLHPHITEYSFIVSGQILTPADKAKAIIIETLFFGTVFLHTAVSTSKGLISLGILRDDKAEKTVNTIACILCAVFTAVTVYAMAKYIITWQGH